MTQKVDMENLDTLKLPAGFNDILETAIQLRNDQVQDQQSTQRFYNGLHYFGPDNGFHAAHHGVNNYTNTGGDHNGRH